MLDHTAPPTAQFVPQPHRVAGFDSPNTIGSSSAALFSTSAAFFVSMFWLNQLVSQMREALTPAGFLSCRSVNSRLARLFRLTAMKAGTSTIGASI